MAAIFGKIDDFDYKKEEWSQYTERLGHFFGANGITEEAKKRDIFLSAIGVDNYKLLKSLLHPALPGDTPYDDLTRKFKEPAQSEIVQRFKFHTRFRRQGESVAKYVSELRSLAKFCNFTNLEEQLRDRLVCGINEEKTQNRLLAEKDLTYKKALELAQSLEIAAQNFKEIKKPSHEKEAGALKTQESVLRVTESSGGLTKLSCYQCGKEGHIATKCQFKDAVCHKCGKRGHLKSVCRSKEKGTKPTLTRKKPAQKKVYQVDTLYTMWLPR